MVNQASARGQGAARKLVRCTNAECRLDTAPTAVATAAIERRPEALAP